MTDASRLRTYSAHPLSLTVQKLDVFSGKNFQHAPIIYLTFPLYASIWLSGLEGGDRGLPTSFYALDTQDDSCNGHQEGTGKGTAHLPRIA